MPQPLKRIAAAADAALHAVESAIVVAGISLMTALIFAETALGFLKVYLPWAHELAMYAMAVVTLAGADIAVRTGGHVRIEIFTRPLRGKAKRAVSILASILCAAACAGGLKMGFDFVRSMRTFGERSPALNLPLWTVYAALPVAAAFMTVRFLINACVESKAEAAGETPGLTDETGESRS
ncbi:MAG: TRAP transporter small permease [bacterium]